MPAAITSACAGGVAGSSAPAITSVGAEMVGSDGRRSIRSIAPQQAAYPAGGVAAIIARSSAARAGSRRT